MNIEPFAAGKFSDNDDGKQRVDSVLSRWRPCGLSLWARSPFSLCGSVSGYTSKRANHSTK